jgi:hypothetical protein
MNIGEISMVALAIVFIISIGYSAYVITHNT